MESDDDIQVIESNDDNEVIHVDIQATSSNQTFSPKQKSEHFLSVMQGKTKEEMPERESKSFKCNKCDQYFSTTNFLVEHKFEKHSQETVAYSCNICKTSFAYKSVLDKHKISRVCVKRICLKCDIRFDKYSELLDHENKTHVHNCNSCNKSFVFKSHLNHHKKIKCKGTQAHFTCEICHIAFKDKASFDIHKLVHISKKGHVCNVCLKTFENLDQLQAHKQSHVKIKRPKVKEINLNASGGKIYFCAYCDKSFNQSSHMSSHKNSEHLGINPFHCSTCDKRFPEKYQFLWHKCTKKNLGVKALEELNVEVERNNSDCIGKFVECDVKNEVIDEDMWEEVDNVGRFEHIIIKEEL